MTQLYQTTVHVSGGRNGRATSDDEQLDLSLQLPKSMGGSGQGTNPEQLFAAGYAACFMGAMQLVAKNNGVALPHDFAIDSRVTLNKSDAGELAIAVAFDIHLKGMDKQQASETVEAAHEVCPYSRATRGNIDVDFTITV